MEAEGNNKAQDQLISNDPSLDPQIKLKEEENESNSVPLVKKDGQEEEEKKRQEQNKQLLKERIVKLISQIKKGCKKDICSNKHCKKNPIHFSSFTHDKEILQFALKLISQTNDPSTLFCSDSVSINKANLNSINEVGIRDVLEDVQAFCSSFSVEVQHCLSQNEMHLASIEMHQDVTKKHAYHFEIDFETLELFYQSLVKASSNDQDLMKQIDSLLQILQTEFNPKHLNPEELLMVWRGFIMILSFQKVEEWDWQEILKRVLSKVVEYIKFNKEEEIVDFLALTLSKERFIGFVQKIQNFVTISILSNVFDSRSIENSLRMLDVFNQANEKRIHLQKVHYKEFYNDAINKEINLRQHIDRWILEREKSKKTGQQFDKFQSFNLCAFPWILDASNKSDVMKYMSRFQQQRQIDQSIMNMFLQNPGNPEMSPYLVLKVNRNNLLYDTLNYVNNSALKLQKPMKVQFIGEPGVDEGGVRKEFFQLLIKELFDPNFGMFNYNNEVGKCWFNGLTHEPNINFEMVGVLMGLAVFNQVLVDMPFPTACYKKLLGVPITLDDLQEWQPAIFSSLEFIINYSDETPLEEVLGTNFTIDVEQYGNTNTIELKMGGSEVLVSKDNRDEYVNLYIDYMFNEQCKEQFKSFTKGFFRVCDEEVILNMFKYEELELFVCGIPELDFNEWKKATRYVDGYEANSTIITWFWEVLQDMDESQKKGFLTFTTGCNRAPILGLAQLPLYIGREGPDSDRLPSSHTCFNHLLIPEYSSKEKLKEKLLIAINNSEGFGLI